MSLPIHRWFRYSSGFSANWAVAVIERESQTHEVQVFDPFAGSGTTLISAEHCDVPSSGIDSHPFIARVARAKLAYRSSPEGFIDRARYVFDGAQTHSPDLDRYAGLIRKCYTDAALEQLDTLRQAIDQADDGSETAQLVWLTLVSVLRRTSYVGTANWQYLLPNRRKSRPELPYAAFNDLAGKIYDDMRLSESVSGPRAVFNMDDARQCATIPDDSFNLVVTSPPYPNNYDYADATRLELSFFGEISGWGDLQQTVRQHLLRSCTQHVPDRAVDLPQILASEELEPIREELTSVCEELGRVRMSNPQSTERMNVAAC